MPEALQTLSPQPSEPMRAWNIRQKLDELVVGQVEAKERLSLLLSMHQAWDPSSQSMQRPPNGIIIGPTGSGKTFSIQVASSFLRVPFLNIDTTSLVPFGARSGLTVDWIHARLEEMSPIGSSTSISTDEGEASRPLQKSVIFFDEFDKIAIKESDSNKEWKTDIQRTLLKFVESYSVQTRSDESIFVLAGGAFVGIDGTENLRKRRPEIIQLLRQAPKGTLVSDDLVNFGFMPELVARFPAIIQYEPLAEDVLLAILQHPRTSPLLIWTEHFARIGKTISFSPGFLTSVARRAAALQMGARALQQVVFPALARHAYAFEGNAAESIEITEAYLDYKEKP